MGLVTGSRGLLHVGCGSGSLPDWLKDCNETRLDINAECNPHIVASMLDMGEIGEFDSLLCQHALEHLMPHEVGTALKEFIRVLVDGGSAMVFVPDLEGVTATDEVLFESESGPITGLDLLYGFRPALEENPYMAHHTGFTQETLKKAMTDAGFRLAKTVRLGNYNLFGVGVK